MQQKHQMSRVELEPNMPADNIATTRNEIIYFTKKRY